MEYKNAPDDMPALRRASGGGGRHRGGAWKVAYADFVTALMALFIVLWLMNSSRQVQQAISAYFRDPKAHAKMAQSGGGTGQTGGDSISMNQENASQLRDRLEQAIRSIPELGALKDQVRISITAEGVRVELMETEQGLFFESGRPEPSANGERMLSIVAGELARLKNKVVIEGHTDAKPYRYSGIHGYTNWELSVDRANAARRFMQDHGIAGDQVVQVRGFADKRLLDPGSPQDSRNRRVTVVVEYDQPPVVPRPNPFVNSPTRTRAH